VNDILTVLTEISVTAWHLERPTP